MLLRLIEQIKDRLGISDKPLSIRLRDVLATLLFYDSDKSRKSLLGDSRIIMVMYKAAAYYDNGNNATGFLQQRAKLTSPF